LKDVGGLQSEPSFDRGSRSRRAWNLRENGATENEVDFLLDARVELNAMTSDQLVAFVERKLKRHGVKKVVPGQADLAKAFRLFARSLRAEQSVRRILEELDGGTDVQVPRNLARRVREHLQQHPKIRWDAAVRNLAAAGS